MSVPDNPNIKIIFSGLLAISFDDKKQNCQVGILHGIEDHALRFNVFKVTPESREKVLELTSDTAGNDIFLDVDNAEGINLYTNGPFTRDESDDPQDFRWIVDIEGDEFHKAPLTVVPGKFNPIFHVNEGLFYTAQISPADIKRGGNTDVVKDTYVAVFTAANLYLKQGRKAVLRFGQDQEKRLPLELAENTSYKIQVFNDCIDCVLTDGDFGFYYEGFRNENNLEINDNFKFKITAPSKETEAEANEGEFPANREHPCGPIYTSMVRKFR